MAYQIESWYRAAGSHGEERHRVWRIRNLNHGRAVLAQALKDLGLCRVTLSRTDENFIWDLWRHADRDQELDSSMRELQDLRGVTEGPKLDISPGVTEAQVAEAMAQLLTVPKQS